MNRNEFEIRDIAKGLDFLKNPDGTLSLSAFQTERLISFLNTVADLIGQQSNLIEKLKPNEGEQNVTN